VSAVLNPKSLLIFEHGGYDMAGEWEGTGGLYTYIEKGSDLNHNYKVDFRRDFKNRRKWFIWISMCLTACNSGDIHVFRGKAKSFKEAKEIAIREVLAYDQSEVPKQEIQKWCAEHALPVFALVCGDLKHIGTTFNSVFIDIQHYNNRAYVDRWLYFNDDIPDYGKYHHVYSLCLHYKVLYISETKNEGCCVIGGGVKDPVLLQKMIELVQGNPRYGHIFQKVSSTER